MVRQNCKTKRETSKISHTELTGLSTLMTMDHPADVYFALSVASLNQFHLFDG